MSDPTAPQPDDRIIDARTLSEQQLARRVLDAYTPLLIGESVVILAERTPAVLREELERELAGAFSWEVLHADAGVVQVRITKRASTALPRIVADTTTLLETSDQQAGGAIWRLEPGARGLDSNIIALTPHDKIAQHIGPDLDVLLLVLAGSGELHTELSTISLEHGALLWLPRKAQRRIIAGPNGLRYLTVHQRKPTLNISPSQGR